MLEQTFPEKVWGKKLESYASQLVNVSSRLSPFVECFYGKIHHLLFHFK